MKRPLFWFSVCFAAGIVLSALTGSGFYLLICAAAVILKPQKEKIYMIICAVLIIAGAVRFMGQTSKYEAFADKYDGKFCTVYGTVYDINKSEGKIKSVSVKTKYVFRRNKFSSEKVRIIIYTENENIRCGDIVTAKGIVRIPEASDNTFDYGKYLKSENISAVMYNGEASLNITEEKTTFFGKLQNFTDKRSFERFLPKENAAFMRALVLGDRSGFTDELKSDFSASGVYHVVAVSGMHISILIMFVTYLLRYVTKRRKIRNILAIVCIIFYLAAIGAAPSAMRAGIIGMLALFSCVISRRADFATSFALSAAVLLAFNPYLIFNAGFLLSYSAVIGICVFSEGIGRLTAFLPGMFRDIVTMSLSAEAATLPIRISYFNTVNIYGIVSNILVIPFIEILYALGLVSVLIPPLFYVTAPIINILSESVLLSIHAVASLPMSAEAVGKPSFYTLTAITAALFGLYRLLKCRKAVIYPVLCAVLILTAVLPYGGKSASVNFLNVSQGDSVLVTDSAGKYYMTDTGKDNGSALNNLRAYAVRELEILFVSHIDDDHSGAAKKILRAVKVKMLILPYVKEYNKDVAVLRNTALASGTNVKYAYKGEKFKIGGGSFGILSPSKTTFVKNDTNENCLVMKLSLYGKTFLLMGDAGFSCENTLEDVKCDVIKIGHHGSRYSTGDELLDRAKPKYAVLSYGRNNFGHPSDEVISKLDNRKIKTYHTYKDGNIKFKISKKGGALKVGCE